MVDRKCKYVNLHDFNNNKFGIAIFSPAQLKTKQNKEQKTNLICRKHRVSKDKDHGLTTSLENSGRKGMSEEIECQMKELMEEDGY